MVVLHPGQAAVSGRLFIPDVAVGAAGQRLDATLVITGADEGREHARDGSSPQPQLLCGVIIGYRPVVTKKLVLVTASEMQQQRRSQRALIVDSVNVGRNEGADRLRDRFRQPIRSTCRIGILAARGDL